MDVVFTNSNGVWGVSTRKDEVADSASGEPTMAPPSSTAASPLVPPLISPQAPVVAAFSGGSPPRPAVNGPGNAVRTRDGDGNAALTAPNQVEHATASLVGSSDESSSNDANAALQPTTFNFNGLPTELQYRVIHSALVSDNPITNFTPDGAGLTPAVLCISKRLYEEGLKILYRENRFHFTDAQCLVLNFVTDPHGGNLYDHNVTLHRLHSFATKIVLDIRLAHQDETGCTPATFARKISHFHYWNKEGVDLRIYTCNPRNPTRAHEIKYYNSRWSEALSLRGVHFEYFKKLQKLELRFQGADMWLEVGTKVQHYINQGAFINAMMGGNLVTTGGLENWLKEYHGHLFTVVPLWKIVTQSVESVKEIVVKGFPAGDKFNTMEAALKWWPLCSPSLLKGEPHSSKGEIAAIRNACGVDEDYYEVFAKAVSVLGNRLRRERDAL
ncbi:hypothetical protein LTR66_003831 [Elasticomyces elasticus]|nr:hypothetical protein LTR66_003831 [Elasticomyces elasticus]